MDNVYSVIKVERCHVAHVEMHQVHALAVVTSQYFHEMTGLRVPAELKLSEEVVDKERVYTSELTFEVRGDCAAQYPTDGNWAYRITLANGTKYIMGSSHAPYPVTRMERTMGEEKSSQVPKYIVTLRDVHPLPIQNR